MRQKYTGFCFILPGFAGVLIFYMIPFLDVMRRSFFSAVGGRFTGLQNYRIVLENEAFRMAAGNTLKFTFICLPLLMGVSLVTALGLSVLEKRHGAAAGILKSIYLIPMAVPTASIVLFWRVVFDDRGMLNGMLNFLNTSVITGIGSPHFLQGRDWMNSEAAFGVLVFCYIWKHAGYNTVLWRAGFSTVPDTVYEAAKVDGAGAWDRFIRITLPCIRPMIFMIIVISLLNSFQVFREAWLVAGDYPAENIYLLQHLFHNWFRSLSVDKMAAGAVLLFLVISVFVGILQRLWE